MLGYVRAGSLASGERPALRHLYASPPAERTVYVARMGTHTSLFAVAEERTLVDGLYFERVCHRLRRVSVHLAEGPLVYGAAEHH